MNRVLPLVAVCLSLLAVALALVPRGDVAPPPMVLDAPDDNDGELEFLRRRVELLEDDNRTLWNRVTALERRPAATGEAGTAPPSLAADVEKLRAELHSLMVGDVANSEVGRAAIKDIIREAQGDQQRERMVRIEERRQQQQDEAKQRWKEFVSKSGLSYAAEQKLTERLAAEEAERTKKMEQLRLGEATWQEVAQYLRTQRKETDDAVTALMDDSQRRQYESVRRADGNGMRGEGGREGGGMRFPGGGGQRGSNGKTGR